MASSSRRLIKCTLQLDMNFSTAVRQLNRLIILHLLKQSKLNYCFRCKEEIVSVAELSIDHKIDWLDNDPLLFWDMQNIAYSHLTCNAQSGRGKYTNAQRKIGPSGTNWCCSCQKFLPVNKFYKNRSSWTGYQRTCKPHSQNYKSKLSPPA